MELEARNRRMETEVAGADGAIGVRGTEIWRRESQYSHALLGALTRGEMRVLELLHYGATNKEISRRLFITENTIKFHLRNIYGKLHVTNRLQALIAARDLGLIDLP